MLIVQKFGGSSLADLSRLRRAAGIAAEARRRGSQVALVVSAAGDSTDELLSLARQILPHPPARELDALLGTGEQVSAALMTMMLWSLGQPARSFSGPQAGIRTDGRHGEAAILSVEPERLRRSLEAGEIAVVAGFQGQSPAGDLSTLGRGGSDTTAVALAAALGAGRCEIYTDVDGIYTADPRLIPSARLLPEIDSRDMLRLAEAGSQVLHPGSVRLAMEKAVPLVLLSSFRAGPGSRVLLLPEERRPPLAGVTRDPEKNSVTLVGRAADGALLEALREQLERSGIPVRETRAEEGCVTLTVAPAQLLPALELCHRAVIMSAE
ncbi:MAG: aspartate kinase [Oscillospiraceae bacterium]|nr:aspartate kinase [Oscillospiraceae bacterium]